MKIHYTWILILSLLIPAILMIFKVVKNRYILKRRQHHYIYYNAKQRKVLHQGEAVLTLRKGSTNHKFIEYMFNNAERKIKFNELYKGANIPEEKYVRKLLADTKLPRTIRENCFIFEGNTIRLTKKPKIDNNS